MECSEELDIEQASTSADVRDVLDAEDDESKQWEDVDDICLLCDKPIEDSKSCTVKERGIATFICASIKRKDKKDSKLRKLTQITVHESCQKMYPRQANIEMALKASKKKHIRDKMRRKEGREFDFSMNCFLCSKRFHDSKTRKRILKKETINNIIMQLDAYEKTEVNKIIASRVRVLKDENDDFYTKNSVYYHSQCLARFYTYRPTNIMGRPISDEMSDLMTFIINFIVENSEECQFSLKSILQEYTSHHGEMEFPRFDRIEHQLKQHFEDEIVVHACNNDRIVCFKRTIGKCIEESWYSERKRNENEEKLRIIELASHIILQDIRAIKFDTTNYNSPVDFLNNATEYVPKTLQLFLDILIKTHKNTPKEQSCNKWGNKIITAAHILMSSVRPRSFVSPILLGLSSMIHTKYSAKGLIDSLHNIGLCASYSETVRFESSIVNDSGNFNIVSDTYLQFVYDNADHRTATIDGKNTFHCMGGIMCVTPTSSVQFNNNVPRLSRTFSKDISGTFGFLPLTDYKHNKPFKLDSFTVRNWNEKADHINFTIDIGLIDLIYFYGKHTAPKQTPNWHGFMNNYHANNTDFKISKIIALPFIKAPPSEHTTILTALIDARKRADTNNQKHCFVTFDLPLFMKASEIIASIDAQNDIHNLLSVIPRLGGFHTAMSFLGSIGEIMTGSGLKQAFCTIFAELSAEKALTGHAFSRSVRGHLLVQAALADTIYQKIELTDSERKHLNDSLERVGEENFQIFLTDSMMTNILQKFVAVLENLERQGPTNKLWVQYFKLICLFQRFIDAERSGNFDLHIQTVQLMIPFFFSSGHHLYAKACLLYVQKMSSLRTAMDFVEYDKFCKQGYYTIRRSNRFWSGLWTDLTIEQVLMRSIKCSGGLTHGRGLTEAVIGKWVLSRAAVLEVINSMELFCSMTFATSEQHVDNRVTRISKDAEDLLKLKHFFTMYNPFPNTDKIVGIYSGMIGDSDTVNCHMAFEIGKALMVNTSNKKFTDVKYKRSSKLVHLATTNSSIKNVSNEDVYISPLLLFQKIALNIENQEEMKEYCSNYELSPIPMSLFDEQGMRKTAKSAFYSNFNTTQEIVTSGSITYVVDGGFFLHKLVWQNNTTIKSIISNYVSYASKHYTKNSFIVFDGYPDDETLTTKSVERSRRKMKNIGREIAFEENTIITNQKEFLSNEKNKSKIIDLISKTLNTAGFRTKIAPEDADRLIVVTAIENSRMNTETTVIIVGEDIDLLVIFSQLATNMENIYFCKEGKNEKHQFYGSNSFKYDKLQNIVAFIHAFCGCDTTSCFYKLGKSKLIEAFSSETEIVTLLELASVFYHENASHDKIAESAFDLIRKMYCTKTEKKLMEKSKSFSLHDLRYLHFSKAKVKKKFSLETLPPTEGAAKQHAFRAYYQLQCWLGRTHLKATDWGWYVRSKFLMPVKSIDPPIPKKLLQQISCSCTKKGCVNTSCSCRKHGLQCTNLCVHCEEDTCYNLEISEVSAISDDECEEDVYKEQIVMQREICSESENSSETAYVDENFDDVISIPSKKRKLL
ncbi:uncharacterized protein Nepl16 isoform X1 [Venturia canescens]|uniref:uncharacterized protein n=1 Tax=Venturia canescens TaxID=32260 RepID=UPI001C9C537F|nr:uncharacterized protein LOC122407095 [Venturia canescens]XP_043274143.1 uncharacterized protein LOC122410140 isoform X1 [Venturia canescens]